MLTSGIIGLPMVGKTTIFNLMTLSHTEVSNFYSGKVASNVGMAKVPDLRMDKLKEMFNPKKFTQAEIKVTDVPGLVSGSSEGKGTGNKFLVDVRQVDALIQVIRAFEGSVPHIEGSIDPIRDYNIISTELILADLQVMEGRKERLTTGKKKKNENYEEELALVEKCLAVLEEAKPINSLDLSEKELLLIKDFGLLTQKPMLIVVNVDENQYKKGDYPKKEELEMTAKECNYPLVVICGQLEMEIDQLSSDEKELFMEDLGISEPGINLIARSAYSLLGLISFFTVGTDEVRAWTIKNGANAKEAAGAIHSDISRGFIRAETISYEDFIKAGSEAKAKERGVFRLEGKDYLVKDGDIISFRFNV